MGQDKTRQLQSKTFSGRPLAWGVLFAILLAAAGWTQFAPASPAQMAAQAAALPVPGRGFELLDATHGWLWRGNELDWTEDGGATWRRITPGAGGSTRLAAVHFGGLAAGWALLLPTGQESDGAEPGWLASTADSGASWRRQPLPPALAQALAGAKTVAVQALDPQRGFVAADLAQSSNFSRGALWYTPDAGATWEERSLPLGEAAQFVDAQNGWLAGGPRGDALWRTRDGGVTWQAQELPLPLTAGETAGEEVRVYPPIFTADGRQVVLPLLWRGPHGQAAAWAVSEDGGDNWQAVEARVEVNTASQEALLPEVDARAWLAAQGQPLLPPVQPLPFFANRALGGQTGEDLRLVQVKLATAEVGWALAESGGRASVLLATVDGGATWQPLAPPPVSPPAPPPVTDSPGQPPAGASGANAPQATGGRTAVVQAAGFDVCDLPTLSELATWRAASPYRVVNLYLGGVLRFCDNERLTAANLLALSAQGWTFIPTWVGPQAPCSVYRSRFSSDTAEAYRQGTAEAQAALAVAQRLGLSEPDGSGTILYYDMESFDDPGGSCVAAAQAFVAGWTEGLHAAGSQAGLYGSACNPRLDRFAGGTAPDAIWAAQWNRTAYDPAMSVWGIACLDNTLWAQSQRIRQYTGGHDETWGGVTLNIDSDVVDSVVADLDATPATPTPTATPTTTPTATPTATPTPTPQPVVRIETPELLPPAEDGTCGAAWRRITPQSSAPAYVTANRAANGTIPPAVTPPAARWQAAVPSSGSYRVEASIPAHGPVAWECPPATLASDTATARYTVRHADGEQVTVANQAAASGGWLLLGVYPFSAGLPAEVWLDTLTDEAANTRTVTAGALRLTRLADGRAPQFLYLPQIRR